MMSATPRPSGASTPAEEDPRSDEVVVTIRNLSKSFGSPKQPAEQVQAVAGVDLEIRRGELIVLLGPSGCGKTTLLRCIAGLEHPTSGSIEISGNEVFSSERGISLGAEQRKLGMMFQSYALWPHMTIRQNIMFPLTNIRNTREQRRVNDERVEQMLGNLGLAGLGDRFPGQLSGGQQQRAAFARALVANPPVILFDEPLSNVDAKVRRRLRARIRQMKREIGFCGLYVTHDQQEAMELADTLAVMENGRIRQMGPPREIYEHPRSAYVADFVGDMNRLEATVTAVQGHRLTVRTELGSFEVDSMEPDVQVGDEGHFAVRPEHVSVALADASSGAHVRELLYLGPRVEVNIGHDGGSILAQLDSRDELTQRLRSGMPVRIVVVPGAGQWSGE